METLPLEVKQMICSCLTPKDLKSVRLTLKDLSDAATIYLIPRLFLFYHPDSCAEIKQIVEHPIFSKHIDTFVFDPSLLIHYSSCREWIKTSAPRWCRYSEEAAKNRQKSPSRRSKWEAHYKMQVSQAQPGVYRLVFDSIAHAFSACPKLTNLVIATNHGEGGHAMRAKTFKGVPLDDRAFYSPPNPDECMLSLSEILSAVPKSLHSLSIIDAPLKDYSPPTLTFFQELKHLRFSFGDKCDYFPVPESALIQLVQTAHSVETMWIDQSNYIATFETEGKFLQAIHSSHLRDCMLAGFSPSVENLVRFFLRHANSLTQLDIGKCCLLQEDWSSVLERVSCSLLHLERIQLCDLYAGVGESDDYGQTLSLAYERKAARYIQSGDEFPEESLARDTSQDGEEPDFNGSERSMQIPDEGLWADYERLANSLF